LSPRANRGMAAIWEPRHSITAEYFALLLEFSAALAIPNIHVDSASSFDGRVAGSVSDFELGSAKAAM
jgi:hypothetical protein